MRLFFARLDEKCKLLGKFEKILKIFDENSIENLNFYFIFILFFENLLLNIEPSEITPVFYNIFRFRGGGDFPLPPPGYALGRGRCVYITEHGLLRFLTITVLYELKCRYIYKMDSQFKNDIPDLSCRNFISDYALIC